MSETNRDGGRRSIRLKGYDYSSVGAYFITICTQDKQPVFGSIDDRKMQLNPAGEMVAYWWMELGKKYDLVNIDQFVVMPDHFHGIIILLDQPENQGKVFSSDGQTHRSAPTIFPSNVGANRCVRPDIPKLIQWFKTMTTNEYFRKVKEGTYPPVRKRLWQRNYYEHVIRTEEMLSRFREYVLYNPLGITDELIPAV